jgi:cytochrome c biogenesis protein CcdA
MKARQAIGTVLGAAGVLVLLVHLALMIFTDLSKRYHDSEIWILAGVLIAVGGLLLLGSDKRGRSPE